MYKRKSKRSLNMITSTPNETEETIENIQKALSLPFKELSNIELSQNKDAECSKAKKPKHDNRPLVKSFSIKFFEDVLERCGFKIDYDTQKHALSNEPLVFSKKLKSALENNVDFPRNVVEFVNGFKSVTKEPEELKMFLISNVTFIAEDGSNHRVLQDSVLKLFLNINCLQEHLLDYILERATEFAIDNKATWVHMLLKPFMFLENVVQDVKLLEGLQQLLDVSEHSTRLEIITCLPDIICNLAHENIVLELSKYLNEDIELTPAILDCMSYVCLPNDLKNQVQTQMLSILRTSASPNFFPNLVNFFFAGNSGENDLELIRGLRDGLDWTVIGTQAALDIPSSQVMTVLVLRNALAKSKNLSSQWLHIVNMIKSAEDHKPLDLIVLLVIYSVVNSKEKTVETIFRKRIKSSLFTCDLLDLTFKKFQPVLKDYLKEMLKLAKLLLKSKSDSVIVEFGNHWFTLMFKEMKDVQKIIIKELLVRDYSDSGDSVLESLNVLTKIASDDIAALKPHSLQIFALVDTLECLSIDGIHHVMDLLCGLAFSVENSFIRDDVHMLINKQLSKSNLDIKVRGIIGGVMAVKHMVTLKEEETEIYEEDSFVEIDKLPDGHIKDAAQIINLILKSTSKFPEMICLFYDELSHILSSTEYIDGKFLSWLSSTMTKDLTDLFIIDVDNNIPQRINGIPISVELVLNSPDEADDQIALNVAKLCFEEGEESQDLRILPSLIRLTRFIYMKQNKGDLSSIDALLGCGVLMPKIESDDLDDINPEYIPQVLDCYVHCINWFREIINAFCIQDEPILRKRVKERLNALISLEKKLANFIKNIHIHYKPPFCSYNTNPSKNKVVIIKEKIKKVGGKKSNGKEKKTKSSDTNDISVLPPTLPKTQAEPTQTQPDAPSSNIKCKLNSNLFRNFDFEVLSLFSENLVLQDIVEDDLNVPNSNFNQNILLLLLEELHPKLSAILPSKIKKITHLSKPVNSNQFHLKPSDVVNTCIDSIPRMLYFMEAIAEHSQKCLDENDGIRDSLGLLTKKNAEIQMCLVTLFNVLTTIYSWSGFHFNNNQGNLKAGLKLLAGRVDAENAKKNSLKDLVTASCNYVLRYKQWCFIIQAAVSLVTFFKALLKIYEDKNLLKMLTLLSLDMLSHQWCDICGLQEKGLIYNQNIDILLLCYFYKPSVEMIKSLATELKSQVAQLSDKNKVLDTFQCINKSNFPLLFRATYGSLHDAIKSEIDKGLTDKQHLELWKNVANTMKDFTDILKIQENRTNLLTFLKKSISLFRLFLSQGIPMMELKLKNETDAVVEILRSLQHSTRFLHSLHCHSVIKKDTTFTAYLPQMKLILETLVYKVKTALSANNCSEAFWMGNLKNKNLQGELISSQKSTTEDNDADEGEDQLPEDDESISSDMDGDLTDPGAKSCSNMF